MVLFLVDDRGASIQEVQRLSTLPFASAVVAATALLTWKTE